MTNGCRKIENTYDYMGRRVKKQVYNRDGGNWVMETEHTFIYDAWNLISDIQVSALSTQVSSFVWGLDLSGTLQGAGGVGGLLTTIKKPNSLPPTTYHAAFDANGNVGQLIATNGTITAHYEYDPYGQLVYSTGSESTNNVFCFSTKYRDVETQLYYYGYRFYAPALGRWINRDPANELGFDLKQENANPLLGNEALSIDFRIDIQIGLYLFALNDPISFWDILGLDVCAQAKADGLDNGNAGGVICIAGKPTPCVWVDPIFHDGVEECIMRHEESHAKDGNIPCDPDKCEPERQHGPKELIRQSECRALAVELDCLQELVDKGICGQQGQGCLGWITSKQTGETQLKKNKCP
ncbi:MAG: RHS repeat-associated core domain-containing protein [Spartobacteria bacterium]|nr:RHS repeat-associated core domain-containing protein [Spartobacteria bacterium]